LTLNAEKILRKLKQKKYRNEYGIYLCEGVRILETAMEQKHIEFGMILWRGDLLNRPEYQKYHTFAQARSIEEYSCTQKQMEQISDDVTPPGVLFAVKQPELSISYPDHLSGQVILYLDRISDPGNLGSIIRTAIWFGITDIMLSPDSADPYNPKTVRSTAGAIFAVHVLMNISYDSLFKIAKQQGYEIVITEPAGGVPLKEWQPVKHSIICMGPEATGIARQIKHHADISVSIGGAGDLESLNLAVATGIILYHFFEKSV
jgi:TrmH family RNA methyltransferase